MLITEKEKLSEFYSCHRIWQGIPGIARTKKGRTFISFYSGDVKETYGNYAVLTYSDSDTDFSEPAAVAFEVGAYRCFDPVLWLDPLDRLWFIWNVMPGERVMAAICDDPDADVLKWGAEFQIGRGIMMNKPCVLTSGEWLFPIAVWKLDIYSDLRRVGLREDDRAGSYVYKTSDNGKSFTLLGGADVRDRSFDEHMVIELKNGVLMMLVRTVYGIGRSYSYDRGKNWSRGEMTSIGGPCSRFFISRLKSGRILLINHFKFTGRNNLCALLSEDDGKTFPYSLMLDERKDVSYPDAVECDDGYVYITYDRERGGYKYSVEQAYACAREILTAKITEQDILNGAVVSEGSFLKNVVSKLSLLCENDKDPYSHLKISDRELAHAMLNEGHDNVINAIFERFPMDCTISGELDRKKLDALIGQFKDDGERSEELLAQIIEIIRISKRKKPELHPTANKIKEYINAHLAEDMTLTDIGESMNMSVYYMSHLFKKATGTTVMEYRNEARIYAAKLMLISSDATVSEIAQRTGFCSSAYFTEVFTRSESIPPTEYRKYHKI